MADVDANTGNGSSENRSISECQTKPSLLRPSVFAPASNPGQTTESGPTVGHLENNPFANAGRTSVVNQSTEGDAPNQQQQQQRENENPVQKSFLLRPSALDKHTSSICKDSNFGSTPAKSNSFKLEPPKLFSPFPLSVNNFASGRHSEMQLKDKEVKIEMKEEKEDGKDVTENLPGNYFDQREEDNSNKLKTTAAAAAAAETDDSSFIFGQKMETRVTSATVASSGVNSDDCIPTAAAAAASGDEFVFGRNLADRVLMSEGSHLRNKEDDSTKEKSFEEKLDAETTGESSIKSIFSSSSSSTLEDSAAKQQLAAQSKEGRTEFKPVEVITGEEEESNVFQFNAKLYVFNKDGQSWLERGHGLLRLNDMTADADRPFQSRLVMRTQGCLRLILNTMIWPGMLLERPGVKSIQISAVDGEDGIRIFLINANPNDAEQIFNAISSRLQQLKATDNSSSSSSNKQASMEPVVNSTTATTHKKRPLDSDATTPSGNKKQRLDLDPEQRRDQMGEESNDSSAPYPETEASNEGFTSSSSPTVQSSASSSDA